MRRALAAALCTLVLVPHTLAAGRELAPRPLIPRSDFVLNLDVAWAGGRFLTVWEARDGPDRALYGVLSDANGHRVSPAAFLIAETSLAGELTLDVVGTNDSFAVFWNDDARAVHMTDVAPDGTILGTRTLALPSARHVVAEWSGDRFLVAVHRENQFRERSVAGLLARDGTVIRDDIRLDPTATPSHIADTAFGFLVFSQGRDLIGHVVLLDGSAVQVATSDAGGNIVSARIGNGRQLVAYAMGDGQLRTATWHVGNKFQEQTVTVERNGVLPVGILPGDGVHLLVYAGMDGLYTIRLDDAGAPVSQPQVAATGVRNPHGASNGTVLFVPHRFAELFDEYVASVALTRQPAAGARETLSIRPARQSHVLVGAGGGSMVAVWNEATAGGGTRIRSARIDRDFAAAEVHEIAADGVLAARTLPWNGTEYLVLYLAAGGQLLAARVGYDGAPIGGPKRIAETDRIRAAATWAGDRWAVAWAYVDGYQVIQYATLSHGGVPSSPQDLTLTPNLAFDVALAFDGNRVHLAWIETAGPYTIEPPPHGHAVRTTRLRRNGRVADATPLAIPVTSPRGVSMAGNGERIVLLVDERPGTTAHAIDPRTRQVAATRTLHEGEVKDSDVAWDGHAFVAAVSYLDLESFRRYLKIFRLGSSGTAAGSPRVAETLAREDLHVTVASSPAYDAVAGLQEADALSGERAVIYTEREMFRP
ncbi:MAG TPA: hypothetical protein VF432_30250 [Thermoanaerobaculia bacterium]